MKYEIAQKAKPSFLRLVAPRGPFRSPLPASPADINFTFSQKMFSGLSLEHSGEGVFVIKPPSKKHKEKTISSNIIGINYQVYIHDS